MEDRDWVSALALSPLAIWLQAMFLMRELFHSGMTSRAHKHQQLDRDHTSSGGVTPDGVAIDFHGQDQRPLSRRKSAEPVLPRQTSGPVPLSYGQEQLWWDAQAAPGVPFDNEAIRICRTGPLSIEVLEKTLNEIIRRHEIWRTGFSIIDGVPQQQVNLAPTLKIPCLDLRKIPQGEREAEIIRLANQDVRRPFDLARSPLLRGRVVRLEEEKHELLLTVHHLIVDCVCVQQVLFPEVVALYEAFSHGKPSPLPETSLQYADYAVWQRQFLQGEVLERHMVHWRKQLGGELPVLELPTDRPRGTVPTFRGTMQTFALGKTLTDALKKLSQHEGATLFATLLAAFETLLFRYSGQDDILVGTTTVGRNRSELENLMGYFLGTVVLRTSLWGNPSFRELLRRVSETTWDAISHDELPLELIARELQPHRDVSRYPFFRVMFSVQPLPLAACFGWQLAQMDVQTGAAKFDIHVEVEESRVGVIGKVTYNSDLFDDRTISRMTRHWNTVLEAIVADPGCRLSDFPLLLNQERGPAAQAPNGTEARWPQNSSLTEQRIRPSTTCQPVREMDNAFVSPRNDVEVQLTKMWAETLRVQQPVSIRDDFFSLGGNSLLAMRLCAQIENSFGKKLPLAVLFKAPTVERLAAVLFDEQCSSPQSCLVPIQPRGTKPPFFCVHAVSGEVLFYRDLAFLLGDDQPLYALQAQGLDGKLLPHQSIAEMAAHYIKEIQALQPTGPYFLGGHCLGIVVAFEMAQQLGEQDVAFLAMLDGPGPPIKRSLRHYVHYGMKTLKSDPAALIRDGLAPTIIDAVKSIGRPFAQTTGQRKTDDPHDIVQAALLRAYYKYETRIYSGRITFFMNSEAAQLGHCRWSEFAAGGFEFHTFPGTPETTLTSTTVPFLAEKVRTCLAEAQAKYGY